jgi:hypothetical protein
VLRTPENLPKNRLTSTAVAIRVIYMTSTTTPSTCWREETDVNVDLTTTEGFAAARAAWKAAGCPADHPYLTADMPKAEITPLAISVTDAQWSAVKAAAPIMRAISARNIAALTGGKA